MKQISVAVQQDHLERLATTKKPILAIEELIWNAFDADANFVEVFFERNEIGGIRTILIKDDGHGIPFEEAEELFRNLGGSWKKFAVKTRIQQRLLHGQYGQGRFKAFALGDLVSWVISYKANGVAKEYSISSTRASLGTFSIASPKVSSAKIGTDVIIENVHETSNTLLNEGSISELEEQLAVYLTSYPHINVKYDGLTISPSSQVSRRDDYNLPSISLEDAPAIEDGVLTVLEWRVPKERTLHLCNSSGFAFEKRKPGIRAPGFNFTAYLKSNYISNLYHTGNLSLENLDPGLKGLLDASRVTLRKHFRMREAEEAKNLIDTLKQKQIYPYSGEPQGETESVERQVFDVLALNLNEYLPEFSDADVKFQKFALILIKQALQKSPEALQDIFSEVLELSESDIYDLRSLLKRTSLSHIISSSRTVADRLNFIHGLAHLIYDHKDKLLERTQLHKLVERETWIFGEEYHLTNSDESLTNVLKKYKSHLDPESEVYDESLDEVLRSDGSKGIVDIVLGRNIPQAFPNRHSYLVIELKRPKQPISMSVLQQTYSYALAISKDERFKNIDVDWTFWAVSNDISPDAQGMTRHANREPGIYWQSEDKRITVWAKPWSEIFDACKQKLHFFKTRLQYEPDIKSSIELLNRLYRKFIPEELQS